MKQQLLGTVLFVIFIARLSGQDCGLPPANSCDSAKFICGYALKNYWGNNFGYLATSDPTHFDNCGIMVHNTQYFQIVPCAEHISLTIQAVNCTNGDGLQAGLAEACDGPVIACNPGNGGGAGSPLILEADVVPGQPYILLIDGWVGDECEFYFDDVQGIDVDPPSFAIASQPGMITFQSLPCGPATLTVKLPICQQSMSPGCSSGWTDYYIDSCLGGIQWNLPPGVEIISPDPHAFTITVQFNQPVTNGMVSVSFIHTCPGIDEDACPGCIPKCCKGGIPPIFISNPGSSFTYVPCEEVPAFCTGSLDLATFNNGCTFGGFGWWQTTQWNGGINPVCFSLENPNLYRIIACDGLSNLRFEVSNCENNRGLEFALVQGYDCDQLSSTGNCVIVPEGQSGEFPMPFSYWSGENSFLIVDGIDLDACDFKITEILNGGNGNGQTQCLADQVIIDDFSPGWLYYTVSFNVTHPDESVVTGGNGAYQNGYFTSAPIPCGTPYSFEVQTGGCTQVISGNSPCYLPPDCTNFNTPVPLSDSCHQAPLLCGNYLENFCSSTAGLTPDQPASATDTIPQFENNGWLRITPCEDSIAIDFQVFDCQAGNELGFFLLSGDCDTMTLLSFISATDGNVAHLTAGGLTPGEIYFLAVDGFYNAECKFQTHVVYGIGTASPGQVTCDCTDSYIDGPGDLCPADIVQYTLVPGYCDATYDQPVGGNGIYCLPPPEACPPGQDSAVLHWVIPPFMNFLSDSINVTTITAQVDSSLLGLDTTLTGTVTVYWEVIDPTPPDTTLNCDCLPGCVPGFLPKDVTVHHDVETIYGEISCVEPCYFYNGQPFCAPGVYIVEQTNCLTKKLIIFSNIIPPVANAGPDQQICVGESTTIGSTLSSTGSAFTYNWSNGSSTLLTTVSPPFTTTYSLTVTNTINGCTNTATVTVQVFPLLTTQLPPQTICEGECVYVAGEEFCSGGNHQVVAESYQGCDSVINFTVIVKPYIVTNQGTIGTLTCDLTAISFMGKTYNQPGNYTVPDPGGCGEHQFVIDLDNTPPLLNVSPPQQICLGETAMLTADPSSPQVIVTWDNGSSGTQIQVSPAETTTYTVIATNIVNGCSATEDITVTVNPPVDTDLGVAGLLTCNQLEINFLGNTYTQPGQYVVPKPGGCGNNIFTILEDVTPPWCPMIPVPTICAGESVTLQTAPPFPSNLNYLWSTGDTTQEVTVTPLATTTYFVTATNPVNGCSSIVATTVEVNQPQVVPLGVVGTLTCAQPCVTFNGQEYCQPGTYSFTENCEIKEFEIDEDLSLPTVQLGVVGTLTCAQPCVTFNGQEYCQPGTYSFTENCEIKEFEIDEDLSLPTVQLGVVGTLTCAQPCVTFNDQEYCQPGTYSFTENCEIKEFQIDEDLSLPTVQLGVVGTLTCAQPCVTYNGQEYCQPGTYSFTENCEIKEFEIDEDLSLPTVQLGVVGTLTCAQPCVTFNGQEYCQPGTYSFTENCAIKEFQIDEDLSLPTVQLGVVGTLTCAQPCVTFNGQEYCQPGTYSFTENCEIKEFEIDEDLSLPTVQLGVVGTLTCAQPCVTFNGQEYCQTGTYSFTENCEIKEFEIDEDLSLPTVQLGVVGTLTCAQPCVTYNGEEYCQPGTYSLTENCAIKEFQIDEDLSLPTVQLGVVGTLTCAQPCVTYNGEEYCQPGTYSLTENCAIKEFQIDEDLSLPTVQLGVVGTLTCAQPCVTFNGQEYCQTGTYSFTENCEIKEFEIDEDLSLPTVQLGVVGTLTCAQPCVTFNGQEYCQPGTYSFTENCAIKEFEVGNTPPVWLELGEDQTIVAGGSAEIQAQTNAQPAIITWHNTAGAMQQTDLVITVQPSANTLYSLEIQDVNGCLLEDSVWVLVKKAEGGWFAPNVIKPGSGGLNSTFTLFANPEYMTEIQLLEIFDRWGNRVFARDHFQPNSPEMGWDGTLAGKAFNPAVFVWRAVLLLQDGTTETVKGDVTVLR